MVRIIALAHQIETMARQKKLQGLDHYLKPVRQATTRKVDQSEALAAMLDRKIARQERAERVKAKKPKPAKARPKT